MKNRLPEIEIEVNQEEDDPEEDSCESIDLELFKIEATNDEEYGKLKISLMEGNLPPSKLRRFLIEDDKVYYVTGEEEIPTLRLYVPEGKVRASQLKMTHDGLGQVGIDKTYSIMIRKYYWPGMFKHIHSYVSDFVTCQKRAIKGAKTPIMGTDIPSYPFEKWSMDVSGPYNITQKGKLVYS